MIAIVATILLPFLGISASSYEADAFPEQVGWTRQDPLTTQRHLDAGWLVQQIEGWYDPPVMNAGDADSYVNNLSAYVGTPFFVEWRMVSDAPAGEVDHHNGAALMVVVGGPVTYHFNMANGLARLIRGYQFPGLYFLIEADVPHTYRLEVFGGDWFEFWIDGVLAGADVPEGVFPTPDALICFGARYHLSGHTTQWDYVRYGVIPIDGRGDYDSDEDVDGRDFYFFHECLTNHRLGINGGPGNDAGPGCRFADFDADSDVDLDDIAAFQRTFTGGQ